MKNIILFCSLFIFGFSWAQEKIYGNEEPYEQADIVPQYVGKSSFKKDLFENLNLSKLPSDKDYFANVEFIIEKDGSMSAIKSSGDDKAFNTEVVRAFKTVNIKWKGAENEGKKVRYHVETSVSKSVVPKGTGSIPNMFGRKKIDTKKLYEVVEQLPWYPRGINNFKSLIKSEVGNSIESYTFTADFIIETDGTLSDVKISGDNSAKNEAIKKAIEKHSVKWFPAKVDGQNVRFRFSVKF